MCRLDMSSSGSKKSSSSSKAGPSAPPKRTAQSILYEKVLHTEGEDAIKLKKVPLPSQSFSFLSDLKNYITHLRKERTMEQIENMKNTKISGTKEQMLIDMRNLKIPVNEKMTIDQLTLRKQAWPIFLSYVLRESPEANEAIRQEIKNDPNANYLDTKYGTKLTIPALINLLKRLLYNDAPAIHKLTDPDFQKQMRANYTIMNDRLIRRDYLDILDQIIISEKEKEALDIMYSRVQDIPTDVYREYLGIETLEPETIRTAHKNVVVFNAKHTKEPTRFTQVLINEHGQEIDRIHIDNPKPSGMPDMQQMRRSSWTLENEDMQIEQKFYPGFFESRSIIKIQSPRHYPNVTLYLIRELYKQTVELECSYKSVDKTIIEPHAVRVALNMLMFDGFRWLREYTGKSLGNSSRDVFIRYSNLKAVPSYAKLTNHEEANKAIQKEWKLWTAYIRKNIEKL